MDKGNIVVRMGTSGATPAGTPVLKRTVGRVISLHDLPGEGQFACYQELRVFCWVDGYPENGRDLPPSRETEGTWTDELSEVFA